MCKDIETELEFQVAEKFINEDKKKVYKCPHCGGKLKHVNTTTVKKYNWFSLFDDTYSVERYLCTDCSKVIGAKTSLGRLEQDYDLMISKYLVYLLAILQFFLVALNIRIAIEDSLAIISLLFLLPILFISGVFSYIVIHGQKNKMVKESKFLYYNKHALKEMYYKKDLKTEVKNDEA